MASAAATGSGFTQDTAGHPRTTSTQATETTHTTPPKTRQPTSTGSPHTAQYTPLVTTAKAEGAEGAEVEADTTPTHPRLTNRSSPSLEATAHHRRRSYLYNRITPAVPPREAVAAVVGLDSV